MTQLLVTLELGSGLVDSGAPIDVIYLDLKKALILTKLKAHDVTSKLLEWIQDFLTG